MKAFSILMICLLALNTAYSDTFPDLYFGKHKHGCSASLSFIKEVPDSVSLLNADGKRNLEYAIESGTISVSSVESAGTLLANGELSQLAKQVISSASAGVITINVSVRHLASGEISNLKSEILLGVLPEMTIADYGNGATVPVDVYTKVEILDFGLPASPGYESFFTVSQGILMVEDSPGKGSFNEKGELDAASLFLIKNAKGKQVTILYAYTDACGITRKSPLVFTCE